MPVLGMTLSRPWLLSGLCVVAGIAGLCDAASAAAVEKAAPACASIAFHPVPAGLTDGQQDAGLYKSRFGRIEVKVTVKGGEAPHNAAAINRLLDGERGAYRDIVLLNTAAALIVADKARDLAEGASLAAQAIDSGAAKRRVEKLIAVSNA